MGQLNLPPAGSIYLDADCLIYSVEKISPYWEILQPMWQAINQQNRVIIGSDLLLLETLIKPLQQKDQVLATTFRRVLLESREYQLQAITQAIIEQAIDLRVQYGLKSPDAIHAATAIQQECALFLSNDKIFQRIPSLPLTLLDEVVSG